MACPSGALLLIPKRRRIGWRSVMRIGRSLGRWRLSTRNHNARRQVEGDNDSLGLSPTAEIANLHEIGNPAAARTNDVLAVARATEREDAVGSKVGQLSLRPAVERLAPDVRGAVMNGFV